MLQIHVPELESMKGVETQLEDGVSAGATLVLRTLGDFLQCLSHLNLVFVGLFGVYLFERFFQGSKANPGIWS